MTKAVSWWSNWCDMDLFGVLLLVNIQPIVNP